MNPNRLLIFLCCFSSIVFAKDVDIYVKKAHSQKLYEHKLWQRFLYMEGKKSLVLTQDFFVSESSDPQIEMDAHIEKLFSSPETVYCSFPARSKWLIDALQIPKQRFSKISCSAYEKYKAMVYPKKVWITFATHFLNTPASSYGHTLLRLSKSSGNKLEMESDLLDYSVTLGANDDSSNPISYAVKGLFGGFSGNFAALPYYFKIREYSDYKEARDLWSYDLNLSPKEIERLVDLIWELDGASFPYYYLTKNCSYYLLALLDAVNEDFNFVNKVPFYVIPIETIKALYTRPNFILSVNYRPSIRQQFWYEYESLNLEEKKIYKNIVDLKSSAMPISVYDESTRLHLLDLAITHFDYAYPDEIYEAKGRIYENKQRYLIMRSKIDKSSPPLKILAKQGSEPHKGHSPEKAVYALGALDTKSQFDRYAELGYRFSYHELEDSPNGHFYSKLNMFNIHMRYYQDGAPRLRLHKATFFDLFSLAPMNSFEHHGTWQAEAAFHDFIQPQCVHCYGFRLRGSYGASFEPFAEHRPTVYALLSTRADTFLDRNDKSRVSPALGIQMGLMSKMFTSTDFLETEFARHYLPFARHYNDEPFVSSLILRYNIDLVDKLRLHLSYQKEGFIHAFEVRLSQYF